MTDSAIAVAKSELRAELRRRRRALSPRFRRQAALAVARHARRWLRPGHTLAAYLTTGSELDTRQPRCSAAASSGRVSSSLPLVR